MGRCRTLLTGGLAVLAALTMLLVVRPATADAPPPESAHGTVTLVQHGTPVGDLVRDYVLNVPTTGRAPRPLVVVLHGRYETPAVADGYSGLRQLGAQQGFVTVFPGAYHGSWNAGTCCRPTSDTGMPDVAFLDAVLDDVEARTPIDPARVMVVGFSNGGMMAYRYACERSSRVAAIGVVSGAETVTPDYADAGPGLCRPTNPVSVLAVHGSADRTVPYAGGAVAGGAGWAAPVRAGIDQFAVAAHCRSGHTATVGRTQRMAYLGCAGDAAMGLVKVSGMGHGWSRDLQRFGFDTSAALWQFLSTKRLAVGSTGGAGPAVAP